MNSLIGMTADFLERLSSPAFGRQENEAYNLRLGILIDNDEALAGQLANTDLGPDDIPSLSLGSWLWYCDGEHFAAARCPATPSWMSCTMPPPSPLSG